MKDRRSFTPEFKRRVVEESLSGLSTPAQVVRKHGISWGLPPIGRNATVWANSATLPATN